MRNEFAQRRFSIVRRTVMAGLALAAGLGAVGLGTTEAAAQALPTMGLSATTTGAARPIAAWAEFCERYPGECAVDRTEAASVTLTPALWQTINTINRRINRSVDAVTDQQHWHSADRWDLAEDGRGDCEDFQLLKRRLLVQAGLPRRALRMTVVIDEKGEGHAVLTIVTNRGDLILDNKTSTILPWTQTGYTFVKRESQEAVGWVALGRDASPVTAANR
ncbi:transglutaminase-like cysteine peptidase [Methylorubrum salsuginis]|uniref:Predicted transglutaminase-like cysteine proteinase n=1 Tax=Methylorubrum salsuginis TaxID=414703 RepID=A0A1I4G3D8_9HYPH|nr:transglutaminase-like cysteine peptidase [Methylorubrum salsuginis]SFL24638.1 Predicted transglutaminase-like cysteine proteinase [Methylorubrum salsuginis]